MLRARLGTAAVLLAVFLAALFLLPSLPWALLVGVMLLLAAREWAAFARLAGMGRAAYVSVTAIVIGAAIASPQVFAALGALMYPATLVFWLAIAPLWLFTTFHLRNRFLVAAVGWVVLIPTWLALVSLRETSPWLLLSLLVLVWLADSAAYFAGRRFGRRKLAPAISPGKTWEGVAGAALVVALYAVLVCLGTPPHAATANLAGCVAGALGLLALSILGDLFESWMKREAGLKDSGALLPGHGGVLDRMDALTSTLPIAAFLLGLGSGAA